MVPEVSLGPSTYNNRGTISTVLTPEFSSLFRTGFSDPVTRRVTTQWGFGTADVDKDTTTKDVPRRESLRSYRVPSCPPLSLQTPGPSGDSVMDRCRR